MRQARKTAIWLALFAIVTIAGDRLGAFVCGRILVASQFRFSRVYRGGTKADVIVIGDSRGVHSFYAPSIEKVTGRPALNLSYNAMSMPIAEALLSDFLDHNPPPRVVLIEPSCVVVDRGLVTELGTYGKLSKRLAALYARDHPHAAVWSNAFHLLAYDSEFFLRALLYLRRSDQDWINRGVIAPELRAAPRDRWRPNGPRENYAALARIVRMLRARGIEVKLVIAPYHRSSGVDASDLVRDVTQSVPDTRIWNYAEAIPDAQYFSDTVHMNLGGSEVLLTMLCRDGVLECGPGAR